MLGIISSVVGRSLGSFPSLIKSAISAPSSGAFQGILKATTAAAPATSTPGSTSASSDQTELLDVFRRRLQQKLNELGIDPESAPVTVTSDGFGELLVGEDHPDATAIAALLNDDSDLRKLFLQIQSQARTTNNDSDPLQLTLWQDQVLTHFAPVQED